MYCLAAPYGAVPTVVCASANTPLTPSRSTLMNTFMLVFLLQSAGPAAK